MPRGGNPALAVDGNSIAVSGVIDTAVATGTEPKGTGIAFSTDKGENWVYLPQPIDEIPATGKFHAILWGGQEISALAVTTEINNVSYDLAIYNEYIYAASWAGGLRRYPIDKIGENKNRQWVIGTKWETQILNFAGVTAQSSARIAGTGEAFKGMWHQYGLIEEDPSKGIFMQ